MSSALTQLSQFTTGVRTNIVTAVEIRGDLAGDVTQLLPLLATTYVAVLAKTLCHNLCCIIQSMHELGTDPDFMEQKVELPIRGDLPVRL